MTDLKRIADALERIARAMERKYPPSLVEIVQGYNFDTPTPPGGTVFVPNEVHSYVCPFCDKSVDYQRGDSAAHNCREPKP